MRRLRRDEVWASTRLAGGTLSTAEAAALLERGRAEGGKPLEAYLMVADYTEAAQFVSSAAGGGRRRAHLRLDEIVELHRRALRRADGARPGAWRNTTAGPFASGMVAAPAWRIPREMAAYVDRFAPGPPAGVPVVLWLSDAHERFTRLHPFERGNGRVSRLLLNLLAQRAGYGPFIVRPPAAGAYLAALRRAVSDDPWPLGVAVATSLLEALRRLSAAAAPPEALRPLRALAAGSRREALYKAAQRGRLRTLRRPGGLYTSEAWIAEYAASRPSRA
jgi:Fic family protein